MLLLPTVTRNTMTAMHKDLLLSEKLSPEIAVHRYLYLPRQKGEARQLKPSLTILDLWHFWHFCWSGRGISSAAAYTTQVAIEGERQRIRREAGEPDEQSTKQLDHYVGQWGLEAVLYAMEMCSSESKYDAQPTLDELRKYLRAGLGTVNRLRLEKRL